MKKLALILICMSSLLSCNNRNETSNDNNDVPNTQSSDTNVEEEVRQTNKNADIELKVSKAPNDISTYEKDNRNQIEFSVVEDDKSIKIMPYGKYYDTYISGKEVRIIEDLSDENRFYSPQLRLYLLNNSDKDLSISNIEVRVESSQLDDYPYMELSNDWMSPFTLQLKNNSWGNWEDATLEYTLLKKGERFNNTYRFKRKIPYFEDCLDINILQDLKSLGFNYERLKNYAESHGGNVYEDPELNINSVYVTEVDDPTIFNPFDNEKVTIHGKITFKKPKTTMKFWGKIWLYQPEEGGAGENEDDMFGVLLKPEGQDYTIKLPYTTTIPAGGNEIIRLKMLCKQSSNHDFTISINNDNDIKIQTKPIHMYYFLPKHACIDGTGYATDIHMVQGGKYTR